MNFVRNASSWICLYLVGTCFFLAANAFVLAKIIDSDNIKQTLAKENTYSKVVPALLSSAKYTDNNAGGTLPLDQPWLQQVVNTAFPPQDIQKQTDTLTDSVFDWLNGTTEKPEFKLDFTANKQQLADGVGQYVTTRLTTLPPCSLQNLPTTVDPYRVACLPPGVNPATVGASVTNDIATSQDFLKDPVISSGNSSSDGLDNITNQANVTNVNLDGVRDAYQKKKTALWVLPVTTVLLAGAGVLLATNRRKAIRRLNHSFGFSAFGFILFSVVLTFGFQTIINEAAKDAITRDILGPVVLDLMKQTRTIYIVFAVISIVIVIVLTIIGRKLRKHLAEREGFEPSVPL